MPLSRDFVIAALGLVVSSGMVGCESPAPPAATAATAPPPKATPQVQMQPLTADQLAPIVGVTAWTATYSGGPIECWLEIDEQGQATMPKRIPEKDSLGAGSVNPPTEGTILLWWSRHQDGQGGQLMIQAPHGIYGYGLNKDAFTFGWRAFSAQTRVIGKEELKTGEPGKEFVIVDYEASESDLQGDQKAPRRIHLKLMGRFPMKK